ncbi:hypothetical protein ACQUW5_00075 [Legionella sp. CNM-1927-20]|uniref:hypothetical protein n=1 Tax=Legionella sp. CNM-1927-20 TaxID=3422221 RepID=UPI00403AFE84
MDALQQSQPPISSTSSKDENTTLPQVNVKLTLSESGLQSTSTDNLLKQQLGQFFLQLGLLDLQNTQAVTQWIATITNFLKPYLDVMPEERFEHNIKLIKNSLITYNDYLYRLLRTLSTSQEDNLYLNCLCNLYKSQESALGNSFSNPLASVREDEFSHIFPNSGTSIPSYQSSLTELFAEQFDSLEDKLSFLLNRLPDINLSDYESLNLWVKDVTDVLQVVFERNSVISDVVRDVITTISRSSYTPNTYTQSLLSQLVANNLNNFHLRVLLEGYNHLTSTKKRKPEIQENYNNVFFRSNNMQQNPIDLLNSSQASESSLSIGQSNLEEMEKRTHKVKRVNSFFSTPADNNFLQSNLEELSMQFSTMKLRDVSSDEFKGWLKNLETLLRVFDLSEEKLAITTLAQALPSNFKEPEFRSQLLLTGFMSDNKYLNLLIDAMVLKYPNLNQPSPS